VISYVNKNIASVLKKIIQENGGWWWDTLSVQICLNSSGDSIEKINRYFIICVEFILPYRICPLFAFSAEYKDNSVGLDTLIDTWRIYWGVVDRYYFLQVISIDKRPQQDNNHHWLTNVEIQIVFSSSVFVTPCRENRIKWVENQCLCV